MPRPDEEDEADLSDSTTEHPHKSPKKSSETKSERDKRTYRACLHCRQRKSRCDLYSSGEPGRPPCERCIREQHECVLGGSRRGGRRVKRTQLMDTAILPGMQPPLPKFDSMAGPVPIPPPRSDYQNPSSNNGNHLPIWNGLNPESRVLPPLPPEQPPRASTLLGSEMTVDDTVVATDLQNPADALEFLAHVAERDSEGNQTSGIRGATYNKDSHQRLSTIHETPQPLERKPAINYPPLNKGQISIDMISTLLSRYEDKYHPFFPLANILAMDIQNLPTIAAEEPHLLAAILTVASKDEKDWWQIHETCSAHMQHLISELVYTGVGNVEAVEAMLILAEWVPRRPHSTPAVGRGEEDQAAWMYVGTAIRLGYLLGIDRTGFRTESDGHTVELHRKRLAWAAVYMSDRQISIRIGKAFWSRGPGPMTALRAEDFPGLNPRLNRQDNFAAIFQANLELTQLFSNAHDVLYATKSRSNQLNFGGEYVKYIDDFRVALRSWHSTWGTFSASPALKASLILSYEYLRLYVNAFAYQATLNRLVARVQAASANGQQTKSPAYPFADVAATPDARFIYDSIDAAKSLLSTFNSFVDPVETFRFMPLRYYLYVIYSACFLYKARSTGVLGGDSRGGIKRLILDAIEKLSKSRHVRSPTPVKCSTNLVYYSACANDVGDRYSRLVKLLWRRPPGRASIAEGADVTLPTTMPGQNPALVGQTMGPHEPAMYEATNPTPSINTFSWLDLPAVGEFAAQNNSVSGSMDSLDRFDDSSTDGFGGFDQSFMDVIPQEFMWNNMSPSGIIF